MFIDRAVEVVLSRVGYLSQRLWGSVSTTTARFSQFTSRADSDASDEHRELGRDRGDEQPGRPRCDSRYACSEQGSESDPIHAPRQARSTRPTLTRRA
jgi:hypothetical protein